jgi:hypothetical protein
MYVHRDIDITEGFDRVAIVCGEAKTQQFQTLKTNKRNHGP